jgi:phosphate/phosphite/phosphonate ABC transporter binding protein
VASSKSRIAAAKPKIPTRGSSKPRVATRVSGPLVFGVVLASGAEELEGKLDRLVWWINKRAGLPLELRLADSYEDLAKDVRKGRVDVAWLPPVVHVRLASEVALLGTILRAGRVSYETALIVRRDSKAKVPANLRGARAGWVDRWSAAGYVLPRIGLALQGLDPRTFFASEAFFGTHRKVVQALLDGECDVAGTYAQADGKGKVKGGAWSEIAGADVRVLETYGAIPPDVIATRAALVEPQRLLVRDAFLGASASDEGRRYLRDAFGGDTFVEDMQRTHESLARALEMASARGLFS